MQVVTKPGRLIDVILHGESSGLQNLSFMCPRRANMTPRSFPYVEFSCSCPYLENTSKPTFHLTLCEGFLANASPAGFSELPRHCAHRAGDAGPPSCITETSPPTDESAIRSAGPGSGASGLGDFGEGA